MSELQTLNLSGMPITDAGLESLKDQNQLRSLILSHTKVTPPGVKGLKQALPQANIRADGKYRGGK